MCGWHHPNICVHLHLRQAIVHKCKELNILCTLDSSEATALTPSNGSSLQQKVPNVGREHLHKLQVEIYSFNGSPQEVHQHKVMQQNGYKVAKSQRLCVVLAVNC